MKRRKIKDRTNAGRSAIVPFIPGEAPMERHARRLRTNLELLEAMRAELEAKGWTIRITNDNHHWSFAGPGKLWEWWPSSAKLVCNKQWRKGIHCHDLKKAIEVIEASA